MSLQKAGGENSYQYKLSFTNHKTFRMVSQSIKPIATGEMATSSGNPVFFFLGGGFAVASAGNDKAKTKHEHVLFFVTHLSRTLLQ